MITKPELDAMTDAEVVRRFREVSVEAADAIWAMHRRKPTDRHPNEVNRDLYVLLPRFDAIIAQLTITGVFDNTETPYIQSSLPDLPPHSEQ